MPTNPIPAGLLVAMRRVCATSLLTMSATQAFGAEYFVATTGSDANAGTQSAPFKTIQKAAAIMAAGDTCRIRAGTYRETVTPANSGRADARITFTAFGNEKVVISGADAISPPWNAYHQNGTNRPIYTASMPWSLGPGKDMIFIDGQVVIQARHPKKNTAPAVPPRPPKLSPLWLTFGDFRVTRGSPEIVNPTDLTQDQPDYWKGALYVGWHKWGWCLQSAVVESSGPGRITVKQQTGKWWFPLPGHTAGDHFQGGGYLTGHLNALQQPGEWHWQDNRLYLWTPDGSSPEKHVVEAKKRHLAFDLRNRSHVTIRGLNIFAASVTMYNADHCELDGCRMSFVSHYTWFDDARDGYIDDHKKQTADGAPQRGEVGVYIGGRENAVRNSVIKYSAGAGLILAGYRTAVTNNIVHDCGYVGTYQGCIFITYDPTAKWEAPRGGHRILNNDLYRAGRSLIHVSSDETHHPKDQAVYEAMDIGYNHLHDGAITANDAGGVFNSFHVTLGTGVARTQIHHNLIWDMWGSFWNALVYPDERTFMLDVHHNVFWQSSTANKAQAHSGRYFFYAHNGPVDVKYFDNVEKSAYDGGMAGLKDSDYPGGHFETGPTIEDQADALPKPISD